MAADATTLKLEVATPKGLAISLDVSSVQAPSVNGEFGVLPGHLPLLAALRCGVLTSVVGDKATSVAVDRGFVEAGAEKVLVLTEACAQVEEVDAAQVRTELADAEKVLAGVAGKEPTDSAPYREALRDVEWAEARLRIAAH